MNERHDDLQEIIDAALREMAAEEGDGFGPQACNLAEFCRRTGLTRSRARTVRAHGFRALPHGNSGTAPRSRRGERVDASVDLSAACPRLAAWPRCCNGCGRYRAFGCKRRPHVFYEGRRAERGDAPLVQPKEIQRRFNDLSRMC